MAWGRGYSHVGLVPSEDLGSWTQLVGGIWTQLCYHFWIAAHCKDVLVEWDVIRRPVALSYDRSLVATLHISAEWIESEVSEWLY